MSFWRTLFRGMKASVARYLTFGENNGFISTIQKHR